jgi:hypothetical protein
VCIRERERESVCFNVCIVERDSVWERECVFIGEREY